MENNYFCDEDRLIGSMFAWARACGISQHETQVQWGISNFLITSPEEGRCFGQPPEKLSSLGVIAYRDE